jgi:hypothetical protein
MAGNLPSAAKRHSRDDPKIATRVAGFKLSAVIPVLPKSDGVVSAFRRTKR